MDFKKDARDAEALLQFQDFGMGGADGASKPPPYEQVHNFSSFPTSHIDIDEDEPQKGDPLATSAQQNGPSMLSWGYYQRYFDVDTPQVKERLLWSFIPRPSRDTLSTYIRPSPDLYGPFWVCVTLVFCIAIMGNIADYLHMGGEGQHWRYDFRKVSISASTIFSYSLLVPFFLWLFLWWRRKGEEQVSLGLMEIICLYGYSLAIYIPISVFWTIPFPFVQWTLVIIGAALSGSVLVLSLWPPLSSSQRGIAVAIMAVIIGLHFLLAAGLQLYFFRYATVAIATGGGGVPVQMPVEAPSIDKVTDLKPLNLVLDFDQQNSTVKASSSLPITEHLKDDDKRVNPLPETETLKPVTAIKETKENLEKHKTPEEQPTSSTNSSKAGENSTTVAAKVNVTSESL